jgi:hypothetical protein
VTPGKLGQNRARWEKLQPGDIALLYRAKRIFSMGHIVLKMHNQKLADSLWSRTDEGITWEYIYFLDDLQEIDIPVGRFNEILEYKPNNIVQGFQVYEGDKSEALLSLLELDPENAYPEPTETSPEALNAQLSALLGIDLPVVAKTRAEQGIFRTFLFGKAVVGTCDLLRFKRVDNLGA